ncbi:DUF1833 family protein [Cohaesibacter celericrescens]|uniref:Transcriptional regulator n=1 Tax=Cohaesibacter celericrescens TaxID=2067669 RepID=A0A2N5XX33_9HYPH|nr:DUF1833 family protein [Cohaesibacter celericrescens]PLW79066.1 transcriptional regulator [Cohaesibacter celericrescens]
MSDNQLSAAIEEAYASAPADQVILHTLEIYHPTFEDGPIYLVQNHTDVETWRAQGDGAAQSFIDGLDDDVLDQVGFVGKIESGAARNADQYVAFIALAFELDLPEKDTSPSPELSVRLDNASLLVTDALKDAATSQVVTKIIYRPYLASDMLGPQMDPPLTMDLVHAAASGSSVVARATVLNISNLSFPNWRYDVDRSPSLA